MRLIDYQPRGLTPSQWRNLAALVAGGLLTLNEHWPQVVAVVGLHYHGLPIPPGITLVLQVTALAVTSLSRALNRAKSGTGTGIVGNPADAPALVPAVNDTLVIGGTPLRASSAGFAGITPSDVSGFVTGLAAALAAYQVPPPPPVVVTTPPPPRLPPTPEEALAVLSEAVKNQTNMSGFSPGELGVADPPAATAIVVNPLPDDQKPDGVASEAADAPAVHFGASTVIVPPVIAPPVIVAPLPPNEGSAS